VKELHKRDGPDENLKAFFSPFDKRDCKNKVLIMLVAMFQEPAFQGVK
jgi:hypothetical protein